MFVKEKDFYRTFFGLTLVIAFQMLITFAVNMADNLMLGAYSENALSGAALVNQIQFLLQMVISGVSTGVVVLGAQYWGSRRTEPIKSIMSLGLKISLITGLFFFFATLIAPAQILRLFTSDETVIAQGVIYLKLTCYTFIIFSISNMLIMALRSVETTVIGPVASGISLILKVFLNYCLIYGRFGIPELGIYGAALSTLISRLVELAVVAVFFMFFDKKLHMRLIEFIRLDFEYLKDYVKVTTPIVGCSAFWGVAMAVQTAILGHLSASAIAASSIAGAVFEIASVLSLSSANAAAVVMGKTVGGGRLDLVKPYSRTLQIIFVFFGLFAGAVLFVIKDAVIGFYSLTEETRRLSVEFMIILSVTCIGTAYEYPVSAGIIQGGGNTKYAFFVDTIFMCLFTLPFAALSAFVLRLPAEYTFCFLKADQILKCIPNAIKCNRYKWIRKLTR